MSVRLPAASNAIEVATPADNGNAVRNSISSISTWGTVDSANPPMSVSDLPLNSDFDRVRVLSSFSSPDPQTSSGARDAPSEEGHPNRNRDNTTPRSRATSSLANLRPVSSPVQITELTQHERRVVSNPTVAPLPPSLLAGRRAQPPETYRANTLGHIPFEPIVPATNPPTDSNVPGSDLGNQRVWSATSLMGGSSNALGLQLEEPLSIGSNALGLQLSHSPQISAPTPRVSSAGFLRSFSQDYYTL